jgi:hypothetical protein
MPLKNGHLVLLLVANAILSRLMSEKQHGGGGWAFRTPDVWYYRAMDPA